MLIEKGKEHPEEFNQPITEAERERWAMADKILDEEIEQVVSEFCSDLEGHRQALREIAQHYIENGRQEGIKTLGSRLEQVRDESYDHETFRVDLNELISLAEKGEVLPQVVIEKVGDVFINPKFNPEYAKVHQYRHSMGYPGEKICVCGLYKDDPLHLKGEANER